MRPPWDNAAVGLGIQLGIFFAVFYGSADLRVGQDHHLGVYETLVLTMIPGSAAAIMGGVAARAGRQGIVTGLPAGLWIPYVLSLAMPYAP